MGAVPIVLAVVLVIAALALKSKEGTGGLSVGLVVAALAVIAFALLRGPGGPQVELTEYEEVGGFYLGQAIAEAGLGDGSILVLRNPTDIKSGDPTSARFRGLETALSGARFVHAGPDPMGQGAPDGEFSVLPAGNLSSQIAEWAKQQPDAVAVVSLLFEFPDLAGV